MLMEKAKPKRRRKRSRSMHRLSDERRRDGMQIHNQRWPDHTISLSPTGEILFACCKAHFWQQLFLQSFKHTGHCQPHFIKDQPSRHGNQSPPSLWILMWELPSAYWSAVEFDFPRLPKALCILRMIPNPNLHDLFNFPHTQTSPLALLSVSSLHLDVPDTLVVWYAEVLFLSFTHWWQVPL